MIASDSFQCRRELYVDGRTYVYYDLKQAEAHGLTGISRLPFSLKVLLENLLRHEDGETVSAKILKPSQPGCKAEPPAMR